MSTYLVLGGTGKVGSRLGRVLEQRGQVVRRASRHGDVRFDWHDEATWHSALEGADGVFVVGPGSATDWSGSLTRFLTAASGAGVRRAVLLSARGVEFHPQGAVAKAEEALRNSPVSWVILRPSHFSQNFTEAMFAPVEGTVTAPVGQGAEPFVDVEDIAEVAAEALVADAFERRVVELSGPEAITFDEAAAVLAQISGTDLRFEDESDAAHVERLRGNGTPEGYIDWRMAMLRGIRSGADAYVSDGVPHVLGRPATGFGEWARREVPSSWWARDSRRSSTPLDERTD